MRSHLNCSDALVLQGALLTELIEQPLRLTTLSVALPSCQQPCPPCSGEPPWSSDLSWTAIERTAHSTTATALLQAAATDSQPSSDRHTAVRRMPDSQTAVRQTVCSHECMPRHEEATSANDAARGALQRAVQGRATAALEYATSETSVPRAAIPSSHELVVGITALPPACLGLAPGGARRVPSGD
jgi:hypothetical protein